jgi:hypothetical protein
MNAHTQYFCYVYDAPGRTPQMLALEADSFTEAIQETRRVMRDETGAEGFAEIWDSSAASQAMTRVEPAPGAGGLLRSIRRGRPSSRFSRP